MTNNRETLEKFAGKGKLVNILLCSKDSQHDADVVEFLSNLPKDRYNVSYTTLPSTFYSQGVDALLRIDDTQFITLDNIKTALGIC